MREEDLWKRQETCWFHLPPHLQCWGGNPPPSWCIPPSPDCTIHPSSSPPLGSPANSVTVKWTYRIWSLTNIWPQDVTFEDGVLAASAFLNLINNVDSCLSLDNTAPLLSSLCMESGKALYTRNPNLLIQSSSRIRLSISFSRLRSTSCVYLSEMLASSDMDFKLHDVGWTTLSADAEHLLLCLWGVWSRTPCT